jgi:hypothetical protein
MTARRSPTVPKIQFFLKEEYQEEIEGDMEERFCVYIPNVNNSTPLEELASQEF